MNLSSRIFLNMGLVISAVALTACASRQPQVSRQPSLEGVAQVYECSHDYEFLVRIEGQVAQLVLPDRTVTLVHQPSMIGAKYTRRDITFWSWEDDEAMLEIGNETRMTCVLNPKRDSLKELR